MGAVQLRASRVQLRCRRAAVQHADRTVAQARSSKIADRHASRSPPPPVSIIPQSRHRRPNRLAAPSPYACRSRISCAFSLATPPPIMSTDKRKAPETFGTTQLVKRTRPDGTSGTAVALADRSGGNGALIQAVGSCNVGMLGTRLMRRIGTPDIRFTGTNYGAEWPWCKTCSFALKVTSLLIYCV